MSRCEHPVVVGVLVGDGRTWLCSNRDCKQEFMPVSDQTRRFVYTVVRGVGARGRATKAHRQSHWYPGETICGLTVGTDWEQVHRPADDQCCRKCFRPRHDPV